MPGMKNSQSQFGGVYFQRNIGWQQANKNVTKYNEALLPSWSSIKPTPSFFYDANRC